MRWVNLINYLRRTKTLLNQADWAGSVFMAFDSVWLLHRVIVWSNARFWVSPSFLSVFVHIVFYIPLNLSLYCILL